MLQVFRSKKMLQLTLLGFSSGLPLYLTTRTLQAWLTVEGINLTSIGLLSLVGLPYSLKFLWAPLLDRFSILGMGRRKGWLLASQLGLVASIAVMAIHNPSRSLMLLAINALFVATLSATQDITVDAYRADVLKPDETAAGAGVNVLGYRIALIVAGSATLIAADRFSWPVVYLMMAALMMVTTIATLRAPEPLIVGRPPETLKQAVIGPLADYFSRSGSRRGVMILIFIVFFRLGDLMIANMTTPFLLRTGFTQTEVGAMQGGVGLIASIVGVLVGGLVVSRIGLFRGLWIFGGLQALSNLAYLLLAEVGRNYPLMVGTVVIENFCTGLGNSALVGFLMSLCNPLFSATQYALLSSVLSAGRDILVAPAGSLADSTGWPTFFLISFIAALPAFAFLPFVSSTEPYSSHSNKRPVPKPRVRSL
jgi:PAT family beta-lactamase induction signal transducer AmpG